MNVSRLSKALIVLLGGFTLSGVAQASDSDSDVSAAMSRVAGASGSGHTVISECGDGTENWDSSTATIKITTAGGSSKVKIGLVDARPDTHYTVWLRMKGKDRDGNTIGPAPITGGGATPLAPTSELDTLVADWVNSAGSLVPRANGFITDAGGNANFKVKLDFPMSSGAYPFNRMSADAFDDATTKTGGTAQAKPTPIVDPREDGITGTPFLIRLVSHCQDDSSHGLSPSNREAWFQFP